MRFNIISMHARVPPARPPGGVPGCSLYRRATMIDATCVCMHIHQRCEPLGCANLMRIGRPSTISPAFKIALSTESSSTNSTHPHCLKSPVFLSNIHRISAISPQSLNSSCMCSSSTSFDTPATNTTLQPSGLTVMFTRGCWLRFLAAGAGDVFSSSVGLLPNDTFPPLINSGSATTTLIGRSRRHWPDFSSASFAESSDENSKIARPLNLPLLSVCQCTAVHFGKNPWTSDSSTVNGRFETKMYCRSPCCTPLEAGVVPRVSPLEEGGQPTGSNSSGVLSGLA
mmetsp:Transcript_25191/g.47004  ORF Transcript_25191/g.47004 Transcript_25191/m.47004 type:complete len:284 (-) Transcript_25191:55-906(-)